MHLESDKRQKRGLNWLCMHVCICLATDWMRGWDPGEYVMLDGVGREKKKEERSIDDERRDVRAGLLSWYVSRGQLQFRGSWVGGWCC